MIRQDKLILFVFITSVLMWSAVYFLLPSETAMEIEEKPPERSLLMVAYLDVQQGDSIVIQTPDDRIILIDGGKGRTGFSGWDAGQKVIVPFLKGLGVSRIDMVVASHADHDHIGGLQYVLDEMPVLSFLDAGVPHTSYAYDQLMETIKKKGIRYMTAEEGQVLYWGRYVYAQVVGPSVPLDKRHYISDLNNNSIIIKMVYGDVSFLFTGDAEFEQEKDLIRYGEQLKSDILKVGHHGAKKTASSWFLSRVQPRVGIYSCGRNNKFGHPAPENMERLRAAGALIYRTDTQGTIIIYSNGEDFKIITEIAGEAQPETGDESEHLARNFPDVLCN